MADRRERVTEKHVGKMSRGNDDDDKNVVLDHQKVTDDVFVTQKREETNELKPIDRRKAERFWQHTHTHSQTKVECDWSTVCLPKREEENNLPNYHRQKRIRKSSNC